MGVEKNVENFQWVTKVESQGDWSLKTLQIQSPQIPFIMHLILLASQPIILLSIKRITLVTQWHY